MNANVAIQPLIKPTCWWETAEISLYKGEIAWEIEGGRVYMLRGDGLPVMPNYTRLRVDGSSFLFTYNDEETPINDILEMLRQEIIAGVSYDQSANTLTISKTGAPDLELELPAADTEQDGLMTAAHVNALEQNREDIDEEKERAEQAEENINDTPAIFEGGEGAETGTLEGVTEGDPLTQKSYTDNLITSAVETERERAEEAEAGINDTPTILEGEEGAAAGTLEGVTESDPLTQKSYTDNLITSAVADAIEQAADENKDTYAPLINPRFINDPEEQDLFNPDHVIRVPDLRLTESGEILQGNQPVPAKNWKDLYDLTLETSGIFLRRADKEEGYFEELLLVDAEEGTEFYREVDNLVINPDDYVTVDRFNELYDLIIDTAGEALRAGDSDERELRLVDVAAGVPQAYREIDRADSGGVSEDSMFVYDFSWID
jgi:hypothetical protein